MDAVEFLKTVDRLCRAEEDCSSCPLNGYACDANLKDVARYYTLESVQDMVQKVEQWAKEHPVKTRQSEFLRMFPNAMINESDGILCITPCNIEGKSIGCPNGKNCGDCRREYWLAEVTDNGNVY
jgi:hypothetical protein